MTNPTLVPVPRSLLDTIHSTAGLCIHREHIADPETVQDLERICREIDRLMVVDQPQPITPAHVESIVHRPTLVPYAGQFPMIYKGMIPRVEV